MDNRSEKTLKTGYPDMKLSKRAIALCRMKYGKGELTGFEDIDNSILDDLTESEEESVIKELAEANFLASTEGNIHLGPLAHHLLNMMIMPEQHIRIDNDSDGIAVSIYIRNTYYLCVIEDKKNENAGDPAKYTLDLLPVLDLIVGAFAYAVGSNKDSDIGKSIKMEGRAWDKDRSIISEISLPDGKNEHSDISSTINTLTMWMLHNLAEAEKDTETYIKEHASDKSEGHEVTK